MRKKVTLFVIVFLMLLSVRAQKITLTGQISDSAAHLPVANAVVMLINPVDSSIKSFTRTLPNGSFSLKAPARMTLKMLVTHPLFADYTDDIKTKEKDLTINQVNLTSKSKMLEAVIIRSGGAIKN